MPSPYLKKIESGTNTANDNDNDNESFPDLATVSSCSSSDGTVLRCYISSSSDEETIDGEEKSPRSLGIASKAIEFTSPLFGIMNSFDTKYFGTSPATSFRVRGPNYQTEKKKIKSGPALFELINIELVKAEKPLLSGICAHPNEFAAKLFNSKDSPPFLFCVNIFVPPYYHLVMYYSAPSRDFLIDTTQPFGVLAKPFFFGDCDKYRDNTFKLIPRIVDGNILVKRAVGSKPTLIGRKLKLHYIRDERFMEVIMDISSDPIAHNIVQLAKGFVSHLYEFMEFYDNVAYHLTLSIVLVGEIISR